MNWSFIANLKLIWCVMNPLCWLASVWKLMAAVMYAHVRACAGCVHAGGPAFGRLRARQSFWCVRCTWCAAHRWVGYAGWAQRGLAEIQAISPTSIITHNYTLNGLKNRVTTNQPGSHGGREKWSSINGPIYIIKVYFIFVLFASNLAILISFCLPVMLCRGASMTSSSSAHRDVSTSDVTQINRSRPHLPLGIPETWYHLLIPVNRW